MGDEADLREGGGGGGQSFGEGKGGGGGGREGGREGGKEGRREGGREGGKEGGKEGEEGRKGGKPRLNLSLFHSHLSFGVGLFYLLIHSIIWVCCQFLRCFCQC